METHLIDHLINMIFFGIGCFGIGYFYGRKKLLKEIKSQINDLNQDLKDKIFK